MIRRLLCLAVMLCATGGAESASDLADDWIKVQQALVIQDREEFSERAQQLQTRARELQARRLTPYAEGLVLWARNNPGDFAWTVAAKAREFDPELPSTYFLAARWRWESRDYLRAFTSYLAGWWVSFHFEPTRWMLAAASVGWLVLTLGWALFLAVIYQDLVYLPRIAHDGWELGRLVFSSPNAAVFAVAILLAPLLVGLGPMWLVAYIFCLSWAYMGVNQRVAAVVTCLLLALIMPSVAVWQDAMLRWPSLQDRMVNLFEERRIDFPTLREVAELEPQMKSESSFHVLFGELSRMHGEADVARVEFQRASLAGDGNVVSLIFLGNMSLEDGDVQLAIQQYNQAIEKDPSAALAYRNLSFAYDQSRRFQDGDAARNTAKQIAGEGWEGLGIPGRDPRIRYPRLGRDDVAAMIAAAPPDVRLKPGARGSVDQFVDQLKTPESFIFLVAGLLGVVVLLVRSQWMWTAHMCSKCGRLFCPRCKTATESDALCSQCISVFLKRDVMAQDQQAAKQVGIRRWQIASAAIRRVAGVLIPGSHDLLGGHPWLGLITGFFAWLLLSGAVIWVPMVIPEVEPLASILPLQVILGIGFLALWLRSVLGAWERS